jgi:hypothetical protein
VALALCAAILVSTGFAACGEDESEPAISTQVDQATARLRQFVADQQQQLQQSAQATDYSQTAGTYRDYLATQQQAEQDLRALQSNQALTDFYAARTRHMEEMTRIIREQMERQAAAQRVYEQQRESDRLAQERLEEQRYQELYEEEQQRLERLDDPYR